jgi:hypothetical protein
MSEDTTYNGWSNYPTWAVNLWLSNDEGLYREALEVVARNAGTRQRVEVADYFKSWIVDELAPDLGASFAADLLGYALDLVDWFEIADSWIEDSAEAL